MALALCVSYANAQGTQLCYTINGTSCAPGVQAASSEAIDIAAGTTTQIITADSIRAIFITSFDLMAAGANNVNLQYGSGVNCATGTKNLTGAYPLIAQAGIAKGNGMGPVLLIPKGNAFCVKTTGGGQLSGSTSYVKY